MIAAPATNDLVLLRLAPLQMVQTGQFNSRLHAFRAARDKVRVVQISGSQLGQAAGVLKGRLIGKKRRKTIGQLPSLGGHGLDDSMTTVAQGDVASPGRTVDIAIAGFVVQVNSLAFDENRVGVLGVAVEKRWVGSHGFYPSSQSRIQR